MQGRVEQADGDGATGERAQQRGEVLALRGAELLERDRLPRLVGGEQHRPHERQPVLREEHVLGAAQPDAVGTERDRDLRVRAGVRVRAHADAPDPDLVGPSEEDLELGQHLGLGHAPLAEHDVAGGAVERDHVAFAHDHVADGEPAVADRHRVGADHRGDPPAAGHHGGVAGQSSARREDALGHLHAVHVLRRGLLPHEHDELTTIGRLHAGVGREVHPAHGGSGRGAQAPGQHGGAGSLEVGVEDEVEVGLGDLQEGLGPGEVAGGDRGHHRPHGLGTGGHRTGPGRATTASSRRTVGGRC